MRCDYKAVRLIPLAIQKLFSLPFSHSSLFAVLGRNSNSKKTSITLSFSPKKLPFVIFNISKYNYWHYSAVLIIK